jgi:23S rRNA (cytidine1920-2'-O)/16S rRNA (cytidine1409-2'-O)-methyltransferase
MVCDASFIALSKVLHVPLSLSREAVMLVKPQFEVGRDNIGRGGIVRDGAEEALEAVQVWLRGEGWQTVATADSPIEGGSGNSEYLLHAVRLS